MKRRHIKWSAAVTLALLCFSAAASETPRIASCHACSPTQRELAALAATPDPGSAEVLVIDAANESVHKYEATLDREPGLFVTSVYEMPLAPSESAPFREIWRVIAASKEATIPGNVCGGVATYLYDSGCQGRMSRFLREGDGTLASNINGLIFGGIATAQQVAKAVNANMPITATLKFPDGSVLRVKLTVAVEFDSGAISIMKMELLEAIGPGPDFATYPVTPGAVAGVVVENASVQTVGDLVRLFESWGVEVVRGCTPNQNRTRMRCDRNPPPNSPPGTLPRCTVTTGC